MYASQSIGLNRGGFSSGLRLRGYGYTPWGCFPAMLSETAIGVSSTPDSGTIEQTGYSYRKWDLSDSNPVVVLAAATPATKAGTRTGGRDISRPYSDILAYSAAAIQPIIGLKDAQNYWFAESFLGKDASGYISLCQVTNGTVTRLRRAKIINPFVPIPNQSSSVQPRGYRADFVPHETTFVEGGYGNGPNVNLGVYSPHQLCVDYYYDLDASSWRVALYCYISFVASTIQYNTGPNDLVGAEGATIGGNCVCLEYNAPSPDDFPARWGVRIERAFCPRSILSDWNPAANDSYDYSYNYYSGFSYNTGGKTADNPVIESSISAFGVMPHVPFRSATNENAKLSSSFIDDTPVLTRVAEAPAGSAQTFLRQFCDVGTPPIDSRSDWWHRDEWREIPERASPDTPAGHGRARAYAAAHPGNYLKCKSISYRQPTSQSLITTNTFSALKMTLPFQTSLTLQDRYFFNSSPFNSEYTEFNCLTALALKKYFAESLGGGLVLNRQENTDIFRADTTSAVSFPCKLIWRTNTYYTYTGYAETKSDLGAASSKPQGTVYFVRDTLKSWQNFYGTWEDVSYRFPWYSQQMYFYAKILSAVAIKALKITSDFGVNTGGNPDNDASTPFLPARTSASEYKYFALFNNAHVYFAWDATADQASVIDSNWDLRQLNYTSDVYAWSGPFPTYTGAPPEPVGGPFSSAAASPAIASASYADGGTVTFRADDTVSVRLGDDPTVAKTWKHGVNVSAINYKANFAAFTESAPSNVNGGTKSFENTTGSKQTVVFEHVS